jgi:hypothetical protein
MGIAVLGQEWDRGVRPTAEGDSGAGSSRAGRARCRMPIDVPAQRRLELSALEFHLRAVSTSTLVMASSRASGRLDRRHGRLADPISDSYSPLHAPASCRSHAADFVRRSASNGPRGSSRLPARAGPPISVPSVHGESRGRYTPMARRPRFASPAVGRTVVAIDTRIKLRNTPTPLWGEIGFFGESAAAAARGESLEAPLGHRGHRT